jgi:hypothetical protein
VEDRINYFERMLADYPDNLTGLLALANEYQKAERYDDEAAVQKRCVASHDDEGTPRQRTYQIRFAATPTEDCVGRLEASRV